MSEICSMRVAVLIVGRFYPNILSFLYEAGKIAGCENYVIHIRRENLSIRQRYIYMAPELKSRYLKRGYIVPCTNDSDAWEKVKPIIDQIIATTSCEKIVFLPVDDMASMLLNAHKNEFPERVVFHGLGASGRGDYSRLFDKSNQKDLARKFGIPVAKGMVVDLSEKGKDEIKASFPCIVKVPTSTLCYTATKGLLGVCQSKEDLDNALSASKAYGLTKVLVEDYLPIEYELGVAGVCVNGQVCGAGGFRKRSVCGGSLVGNTLSGEVIDIRADKKLLEVVNAVFEMLRDVAYNGMFDVDMAYANGEYYLIEINWRVGAFNFSIVAAGVNLVELYLNGIGGRPGNGVVLPVKFGEYALNERSLLEELGYCRVTLSQYFRELRRASVRKIKNTDDPGPYRFFTRLSILAMLSNMLGKAGPVFAQVYHCIARKRG